MILPYQLTNRLVGTDNIVRGDAVFVKSPTCAEGNPFTNTVLTEIIVLFNGEQDVSLQTGNPGAGINTSPPFALGMPAANTVETIGVTVFGGYTQQGLNEIESGFPKPAIGRVICFEFLLASIETNNYFFHNYV